jgi:hypothetical protein
MNEREGRPAPRTGTTAIRLGSSDSADFKVHYQQAMTHRGIGELGAEPWIIKMPTLPRFIEP